MYRVILECRDIVDADLDELSKDIEEEFTRHRVWHQDVRCWHEDGIVFISTLSDGDTDGMALLDEFGDAVVANHGAHGPISVLSVTQV